MPAAGWGQPQSWGQQTGWGPGPAWQTAPPGMEKRRRPVLLTIGVVLMLLGTAGVALGIVRIVDAVRIPEDEIMGRSFVGGPPIQFERTDDQPDEFTIYLDTGSTNSSTTDRLVDATTCTIALPDGSTLRRDGNDLSMSVNLDGTANVGSFRTGSGTVNVSCSSGRASGIALLVAEGGPRLSLAAFGYLFGGVGLLVVGIILTIVGSIKRWRPIKRSDAVT